MAFRSRQVTYVGAPLDREQNRNIEHSQNTQSGDKIMARWVRDMLSLASCGGFVWMAWQAAFLIS